MKKAAFVGLGILLCALVFGFFRPSDAHRIKISWNIAPGAPFFMGVIPYMTSEAIHEELGPLTKFLGNHLKRPVSIVVATDYEMLGRLLDYGKVHFAWFSATSYHNLNLKNDWEVLCRPVRGGEIRHRGQIVARSDSSYKSLADLKGKTFAYVDRNSGTGFVYPNKIFREAGIDPLEFFGEVVFTGNHTHSQEGLLSGKYDAIATFDIARAQGSDSSIVSSFTVLAETDFALNDPMVVRKDLDPDLKKNLTDYMVKMDEYPDGVEVIRHLRQARKWDRFIYEGEVRKLFKLDKP